MKECIKPLLAGVLSLVALGAMNAAEPVQKTDKNLLYDVYEEKMTEDTPLQAYTPDEKVSYLWSAERDIKMDGYDASFDKAEKAGFDMFTFGCRQIAAINKDEYKGIPQLEQFDKFLAEAKKRNMRVMVVFNFNIGRAGATAEEKGTANLLDREYNERQFRLIDAIAEENKIYGNIIIYWDEIWCDEGCYLRKDYIASFKTFCAGEYGEEYKGTEMPPKMNPSDKWWRRYVVFKNCIYENFCRRLLDYTHKKGLKVENRPYPSYASSAGWKWGMDSYRLSKLADYNQTWFWRGFEGDYYENSLMGMYKVPDAVSMSLYLKGYPAQYLCYTYLRDNPWVSVKIPEMMKQAKIWRGAERKAEVCILNYSVALIGLFADKSPAAYNDNDGLITERLSRYFETDRTDVRNSRFYKNYKVLIIPKYSACSIPEYAYNGLLEYVKNGGTIITTDAGIGIGKRDLTAPKDMTTEITGIKPVQSGKADGIVEFQQGRTMPVKDVAISSLDIKDSSKTQVIASYKGKPVITEYTLGKGRVVYIGFNIAELIKKDGKWLDVLKDIVVKYNSPAVLSDGKINIESVIGKDGRALISLYPATDDSNVDASKAKPTDQMGDLPSADKPIDKISGNLSIDTAKLGLEGKVFQIFGVSSCGIVKNKNSKDVWTADELKEGAPFMIDGNAGYEHLIIEPPGTAHTEKGIIQAVADVDKNVRERIAEGKEHPIGLNKNPFTVKTVSSDASYETKEKWAVENSYRVPFYMENSFDFARKSEPVILKWQDLVKGTVSPVKKDSVSIYRVRDGKQEPVCCQVNCSGTLVSENAEIVFIDDFEAKKKNEYILYFGNNSSVPKNGNEIVVGKTKGVGADKISTGIVSAEIQSNSQITLSDEKTGEASLVLNSVGGRYEGRSNNGGNGKFEWTAKGPVHCRVEIKTGANGTVFRTVYEFFRNSPYVIISYLSSFDKVRMDEGSYRPLGTLPGPASGDVLTASGWAKIGANQDHGIAPMRNNVTTIIKRKNMVPFGWILAYSDIPEYPRMLMSNNPRGGEFIFEFAKHHCDLIPQYKPYVKWIYIHNVSTENGIGNCAKAMEHPLPLVVGPMKTMKE